MDKHAVISALERAWANDARWNGMTRPYNAGDVYRLRGSIDIEYSLARYGAARLWELLRDEDYVAVLSAITGNQAIQQVQAGLKAIYVSGWQVAADANHALEMYPDQSLYPSDSVPALLRRINNALKRADEIAHLKDDQSTYWFAPLVADAEAGFGGPLHAFEIMKNMIDAGAAGVHFEDQLASVKKCGHLGGKVLVPTSEFITKQIAAFQRELGALDYKFQFVTLSAFHSLNHSMFTLARDYKARGMAAYADLQDREFASEKDGYAAVRHQEFVGVGYFDEITQIATGGQSSVTAMEGSTEQQQFHEPSPEHRKKVARR